MRTLLIAAGAVAVGLAAAAPATAQKDEDLEKVREAVTIMTERDPGMQEWFDNSHAYAVFPNVGKAGFGVGGAHGNGIAYVGHAPIGKTELSAVTIGLQARCSGWSRHASPAGDSRWSPG